MSSEEVDDTLYAQGNGFKTFCLVISLAIESLAWGAYLLLFIFAMTIYNRRGIRTLGNKLILGVTILLFSSSTVLWALNLTTVLIRINTMLMDRWNFTWAERALINQSRLLPYGSPMEALFMLNMLVGDAVVVVRAKVIWGKGWKIVALPSLFLLGGLAFSILSVICTQLSSFGDTSGIVTGSYACQRGEPIAWALSLITNVMATSLIAYKAWIHRRSVAVLGKHRMSQAEKILSLMVESGFVYILLLLAQLAVFWDTVGVDDSATLAWAILAPLGDQITGMYATGLMVLVSLRRTYWDDSGLSKVSLTTISQQGPSIGVTASVRFAPSDNATFMAISSQGNRTSDLPIELKTTSDSNKSDVYLDSQLVSKSNSADGITV